MPLEIALVRRLPVRQRAITFAFIKRKRFVDLAESPLGQFHCLDRPKDARSVNHHHVLPHTRDRSIATAQHVARFRPAKTKSASSLASAGLSPNENRSRVRQFILSGMLILPKKRLTEPCPPTTTLQPASDRPLGHRTSVLKRCVSNRVRRLLWCRGSYLHSQRRFLQRCISGSRSALLRDDLPRLAAGPRPHAGAQELSESSARRSNRDS